MQETRAVQMDDHRMGGGPALGLKDLAHGIRVLGIGAEPVNGFGGECDELAVAQRLHGSLKFNLTRSDDPHHGADSTKARHKCL